MTTTLAELAQRVGGILQGAGDTPIRGAATIDEAGAGEITLLDHANRKRQVETSRAAAAVVPMGVALDGFPTVAVKDVHQAFATIVMHFRPPRAVARIGISSAAYISATADLADQVDVHPGATIGEGVCIGRGTTVHAGVHIMAGCKIGEDVTLFPCVVLYENTEIGSRTVIHAGSVLGAYGFGYQLVDGKHRRSAQLGHVRVGADVEIGACTTIDRGTYGATVIDGGTKIDNQVMIAHNCQLGRHNLICSQVGIAGSTTVGDYVVMAGQVGVRDHVHIGQRAVLGAKAGVINDVTEGVCMIGIPATPERTQKLKQAALAKLPETRKEVKRLTREVARLTAIVRGADQAAA
ncbi:MAG: UDP-3-O-(3-hydroxymyristoyl)glucosamine N-acyltransferase [Pirellulales bacterium]